MQCNSRAAAASSGLSPSPLRRYCRDERRQARQRRLDTTRRRADTLIEDGYRFELDLSTAGRLDVIKPNGQRAYHLQFNFDGQEQRWAYTCDCSLFQSFVTARQFDATIVPECKHGERGVRIILAALALADHIRAVLPAGDRFATATVSVADDASVTDARLAATRKGARYGA
jgi:hypothetical protein